MEDFNLYIVLPSLLCFIGLIFYNVIPGVLSTKRIHEQLQTMKILQKVRENKEKERLQKLLKWKNKHRNE